MFSSEETKLEHVINENKKLKDARLEVEERLGGFSSQLLRESLYMKLAELSS
jgi:hypothetical protein